MKDAPTASGFPQELVQQGPGPDQPDYGVQPVNQPPAPDIDKRGAFPDTGYHADLEYIRMFHSQNAILRQIYDALTGRGRPAKAMQELQAGVRTLVQARMTIENLIVTNAGGAATVTLALGTRTYSFPMLASSTVVLPLPLVIEKGTDVLATNGQVFLVGSLTAAEGG